MKTKQLNLAVTGVLGYSGKYIAGLALSRGHAVAGLTNSAGRTNPAGLPLSPLNWDDPKGLTASLAGCDVLVNTYWVRYEDAGSSHDEAVRNSCVLFRCARDAGVRRIVHVSITNPDRESGLSYFRGKAVLEDELRGLGVPCSILRPAVLFGGEPGEDILLNNMAWVLRRLPVIGLFGKGDYRLQPIHVSDLAVLAVREAEREDGESVLIDAVGPETYTFRGLFRELGRAIGCRRPAVPLPPCLAYPAVRFMGMAHGDVMLTRDEIHGLMDNRLYVSGARPAGGIALSDWIRKRADTLGRRYASELARRNLSVK